MHYLDKIDISKLKKYVDNDLITIKSHDDFDMNLLLYTYHVKEQNAWDLYTSSSRGLVIDSFGNILARPFQKFPNLKNLYNYIESNDFEIFEKLDGSLGILFYAYERWFVTTKGSFNSEQAKFGYEFLYDKLGYFDKNNTYLFEIIYPENEIIIDYRGMTDVVLLGVINTKTGIELTYDEMILDYSGIVTIVNKIILTNVSLNDLKNLNLENHEGFVVKYPNNYRIKVKFERYDVLHRIFKFIGHRTILNALQMKEDIDKLISSKVPNELLSKAPIEFHNWVNKIKSKYLLRYYQIKNDLYDTYHDVYKKLKYNDELPEWKRKEFAIYVKHLKHSSLLFKIYDNKINDNQIWDMIWEEN